MVREKRKSLYRLSPISTPYLSAQSDLKLFLNRFLISRSSETWFTLDSVIASVLVKINNFSISNSSWLASRYL